MVARVHHATLAKANKLGFTVTGEADDEFYTVKWPERNKTLNALNAPQGIEDMAVLKMLTLEYPKLKVSGMNGEADGFTITDKAGNEASGATLQEAWDEYTEAVEELDDADAEDSDGEPEDEEGDEDEGKSVVKRKYKSRYKPFKQKCGDELSKLISDHVRAKEKGDDGRPRIDRTKLVRFAKANGVWDPHYEGLNIGMVRMNISNRLRGKVRRDNHEIVWS